MVLACPAGQLEGTIFGQQGRDTINNHTHPPGFLLLLLLRGCHAVTQCAAGLSFIRVSGAEWRCGGGEKLTHRPGGKQGFRGNWYRYRGSVMWGSRESDCNRTDDVCQLNLVHCI
jgi:hypothetical protein